MPLVARDSLGFRRIAPLLTDEAWEALKEEALQADCCDTGVFQRTSSRGVRHFVHRSTSQCSSKPESWQHLLVKSHVSSVLRELGGEVDIEVELQGVRADVLYRGPDDRPLAVEVQWSNQTLEEHERRTNEYLSRGIDVVWLYRSSHFRSRYRGQHPASRLISVSDDGVVHLEDLTEGDRTTLDDVLTDVGQGTRWVPEGEGLDELSTTPIAVHVVRGYSCWKCTGPAAIFEILGAMLCCLEDPVGEPGLWSQSDLLGRAQKRGQLPLPPEACSIEYTKTSAGKYWAHICPHCGTVQGDAHLLRHPDVSREELESAVVLLNCTASTVRDVVGDVVAPAHWCTRRTGST